MIVEYLRYRIDAERGDAFVDAYRAAADPLLASPHCHRFELARCEEEPACFTVRIEWSSTEDHLQRFRGSPEFRAFFGEFTAGARNFADLT